MKIGVNDGHTLKGVGSGAVGIINESEHTRKVGNVVRKLLTERGHKAINCTIDYASTVNESLLKVVEQANRVDLDWFIAIHFNAGGGKGVEVYTYEGRKYQDALDVCSNISKLGFNNRGVKAGTGLYVVSKTKAKAMLIEVCFVDTEDANKYLSVGSEAIGKAIVDALCKAITSQATKTTTNASAKAVNKSNISVNLKDWQKAYKESGYGNILVDGIMGQQTNTAMHKAILKQGCNNPLVGWLQCRIGADIDNVFGAETRRKVLEFQKDNGLIQDGIVGVCTWSKLLEKYSN